MKFNPYFQHLSHMVTIWIEKMAILTNNVISVSRNKYIPTVSPAVQEPLFPHANTALFMLCIK